MQFCRALNQAGQPCRIKALKDSDFCSYHQISEEVLEEQILRLNSHRELVLFLGRIRRNKQISFGVEARLMVKIFDRIDTLDFIEKEKEEAQKPEMEGTRFF